MSYVYLDNGAATRPDPDVLEEMRVYEEEWYGVPSSDYGHTYDLKTNEAVEDAREKLSDALGAEEGEVVFTSGTVESNNLAIRGAGKKAGEGHVVISDIEHSSVLNSAKALKKEGFEVTKVGVDEDGLVDPDEVEEAIRGDTVLVSIGHANNEIGSVQDIEAIGEVCDDNDVMFHTDATASFTKVPLDVEEAKVDLATISGRRFHGPQGTGALYVRNTRRLKRIMEGGDDEFRLRPGKVNVPGAVGLGRAAEIGVDHDYSDTERLRDQLIDGLLDLEKTKLNGHPEQRLPTNVNVTFYDVEGESILLQLDMREIAVSTGSACYSEKLAPSHVLDAIGLDPEVSHGSIRFSLSKYTTEEDIEYTLEAVEEVTEHLRDISALGKKTKVPGGS